MLKALLVDDEPLVLIGLQGMLDWNALGWEVVGTARNGSVALEAIREKKPDLVMCDIRMPVMDGLELARRCREEDPALPLFIMLTSYEEFDYVKQSLRLGALEYMVKLELTPESLQAALQRAAGRVARERALQKPPVGQAGADGLAQYRERFFLQLYGGQFDDEAVFGRVCEELGLRFDAPAYVVALGAVQNRALDTEQLATLSAGITKLAADTLPKFLPCTVTGMDLRHFSVLFPLKEGLPAENLPEYLEKTLGGALKKAGEILYEYFGSSVWWSVGQPVENILEVKKSQRTAFAGLSLLSEETPAVFGRTQAMGYHAQQVVQIQEYINQNLDKRLSLNDVASVFGISPNYLSQLFAQWGESGFVEFVTAARVNAAKELMASTSLKIYEISEKLGFESAFYFSKVFKKVEGVTPRAYMQRLGSAEQG